MATWQERFQTDEYIYGTEPNDFIKAMHPSLAVSGTALAIAEGEGRNAVYLAEQGMEVTAWDLAASGLEKAQRLAKKRGVPLNTEQVDLAQAEWLEAQWDEIICVFGHFPKSVQQSTFNGIRRALKPGGYFLMEVYSDKQPAYGSGGPKEPALLYTAEQVLQAFGDYRIVHLFTGEAVRHEGDLHNGLSHVIQLAAQKPSEN